ncbi:zinc finger protein ZAT5-like, partial [Trifolium medium]|nr:zinc finger protein ZAT5-like [Trifolium medium]
MAEEKEKKEKLPSSPPTSSSHDSQSVKLVANRDEFEEAEKPRGGPTISFLMGNQGLKAINGNKGKIHECSICGSEFTSGQALGGHM